MTVSDEPRWGPWGAVLGLIAIALWSGVTAAFSLLARGPAGAADPAWSFVSFILAQSGFVLAALGVARASRSSVAALGAVACSRRALWHGLVGGIALFLAALLYAQGLRVAAPLWFESMQREQQLQLAAFPGPTWTLILAAVLIAPPAEELFFRGLLFRGLDRAVGSGVAALLSGLIFAAAHMMPYSALPLVLIGVVSSLLLARHRSLVPCIVMHASFNLLSLALGSP